LTSERTVAATWSLAVSWTSIKYSFHNQRCHWAYESLEHVRGTIDFSDETSPFQSRTGNIELLGCPCTSVLRLGPKLTLGNTARVSIPTMEERQDRHTGVKNKVPSSKRKLPVTLPDFFFRRCLAGRINGG
jgi:hypothetical protein